MAASSKTRSRRARRACVRPRSRAPRRSCAAAGSTAVGPTALPSPRWRTHRRPSSRPRARPRRTAATRGHDLLGAGERDSALCKAQLGDGCGEDAAPARALATAGQVLFQLEAMLLGPRALRVVVRGLAQPKEQRLARRPERARDEGEELRAHELLREVVQHDGRARAALRDQAHSAAHRLWRQVVCDALPDEDRLLFWVEASLDQLVQPRVLVEVDSHECDGAILVDARRSDRRALRRLRGREVDLEATSHAREGQQRARVEACAENHELRRVGLAERRVDKLRAQSDHVAPRHVVEVCARERVLVPADAERGDELKIPKRGAAHKGRRPW
mmetsp:Transcript_20542/g.63873  ORF Transcript_20542/g.63873 Transcript_20542/m.63873 type:complete len:332 (-) Transcript_20542:336-1331(-)